MGEFPAIPVMQEQEAFNLDRWDELCADPVLAAPRAGGDHGTG